MRQQPQLVGKTEAARRTLKERAAARGESLNTYLLNLIDREATTPTAAEVLDRAARRSERASVSALEVLDEARSQRGEHLRQVTST